MKTSKDDLMGDFLKPVDLRIYETPNRAFGRVSIGPGLLVFVNDDFGPTELRLGCPEEGASVNDFIESFDRWADEIRKRILERNDILTYDATVKGGRKKLNLPPRATDVDSAWFATDDVLAAHLDGKRIPLSECLDRLKKPEGWPTIRVEVNRDAALQILGSATVEWLERC